MLKNKKMFALLAVGSILLCCTTTQAGDVNQGKAYGGWSESQGSWSVIRERATDAPKSHKGKRLIAIDRDGIQSYAAYGETIWKDTYHYTTARMENTKGDVRTSSGRQWGTGYTEATSPYYYPKMFENTEARTYWGKE